MFGSVLADGYDAFYGDRDVAGEIDRLCETAVGWLGRGWWDVLDLGCGTGQHIAELVKRNHRVVGMDISAALVRQAQERNPGVRVEVGDLRAFALGQQFDLVIALFGVFDYLPGIADVRSGLRSTALHIRRDGLFYLVVSRAGAMNPKPQAKQVLLSDGSTLHRLTKPSPYDHDTGTLMIRYDFERLVDGEVVERYYEKHAMRGYTATELRLFLPEAGLRIEQLQTVGPTFHVLARRTG